MKSGSLDYWRNYFRTANSDIFDIINYAIIVAASDCPKEFQLRRDRIAEHLFSCRLTRCSGCNQVKVAVPAHEGGDFDGRGCKSRDGDNCDDDDDEYVDIGEGYEFDALVSKESKLNSCNRDDDMYVDIGNGYEFDVGVSKESKVNSCNRDDDMYVDIGNGYEFDVGVSKESKVNSCNRDDDIDNGEVNLNDQLVSNYSYGVAEALNDAIEEESQIVGEVLRIKDILINRQDQSDSALFDSLRRLQLMALTVDTLKATEIGKAVNGFRKHGSKQIRNLARSLIDGWKDLVDEWYSATQPIKVNEGTPDSVNPSVVVDEEGLPSPPLDEGALFSTHTAPIELSQFFDGMDDDGNPRNNGEFIKTDNRRHSPEMKNITKQKQQNLDEANGSAKDRSQQLKKQDAVMRTSKPSNTGSGPGRPPRQCVEHKSDNQLKLQQKTNKITGQRKPPSGQQDKLKCSDEAAVQKKLEATKRKLHESYQQAENAKRQRTIQVMELRDLPKQGLVHKNPHMRSGNQVRHWAHGRR